MDPVANTSQAAGGSHAQSSKQSNYKARYKEVKLFEVVLRQEWPTPIIVCVFSGSTPIPPHNIDTIAKKSSGYSPRMNSWCNLQHSVTVDF